MRRWPMTGQCEPAHVLPVDLERLLEVAPRLSFGSWQGDFGSWQAAIRSAWEQALPPPDPVIAMEQGPATPVGAGIVRRKLWLCLAGGRQVEGAALLPDGLLPGLMESPEYLRRTEAARMLPAILMLHDHGGRFDIGWRKLIPSDHEGARAFAQRFYGGFPALPLVRAGHPVFAFDAFGWGARAVAGQDQQALGWQALALGSSLQALVAAEDREIARWLLRQELAGAGIAGGGMAAWGFSFGGFRAWQLLATLPELSGAVALSWMARRRDLIRAGAPVTAGQSAFWMLDPGLAREADLPDLAGAGAPRPLFLRCGDADRHLPRPAVEAAHADLRAIWQAAGAERLPDAALFTGGHLCPPEVQAAALRFLADLSERGCSR